MSRGLEIIARLTIVVILSLHFRTTGTVVLIWLFTKYMI